MIGFIDLINDGSGYVSAPTIEISPPPNFPVSGSRASAVAITTSIGGVRSLKEILLTNPGSGYNLDTPPLIIINGGGGAGAAVTFGIIDSGISSVTLSESGRGYNEMPTIVTTGITTGSTAELRPVISAGKIVTVRYKNVGSGYVGNVSPVTISGLTTTGIGTFIYNEIVTGDTSGVTARVKDFNRRVDLSPSFPPIELRVSLNSGAFYPGEVVVGGISSARYIVESYNTDSFDDPYDANSEIELEADNLLDFTEGNPFGDY